MEKRRDVRHNVELESQSCEVCMCASGGICIAGGRLKEGEGERVSRTGQGK